MEHIDVPELIAKLDEFKNKRIQKDNGSLIDYIIANEDELHSDKENMTRPLTKGSDENNFNERSLSLDKDSSLVDLVLEKQPVQLVEKEEDESKKLEKVRAKLKPLNKTKLLDNVTDKNKNKRLKRKKSIIETIQRNVNFTKGRRSSITSKKTSSSAEAKNSKLLLSEETNNHSNKKLDEATTKLVQRSITINNESKTVQNQFKCSTTICCNPKEKSISDSTNSPNINNKIAILIADDRKSALSSHSKNDSALNENEKKSNASNNLPKILKYTNHQSPNNSSVQETNNQNKKKLADEKKKPTAPNNEIWTGQIETKDVVLSVKAVSLLNSEHSNHSKFSFLVKSCLMSKVKSIKSKEFLNIEFYQYLNRIFRSHYFLILQFEPFETNELKNTIKIMNSETHTNAYVSHKNLIEKLLILNENGKFLEMEMPESCSSFLNSFYLVPIKAKYGESAKFFKKLFNLDILRDKHKLIGILVSKQKDMIEQINISISFEKEKKDDAIEKNKEVSNEKIAVDDLSKSISNKRKNDSVDSSSYDCKKPRLGNTNSSTSSQIHSQERSLNSKELSKRSSGGHRQESENDEEEKAKREKNIQITGLDLTNDRKEEESIVEALFEIGEK